MLYRRAAFVFITALALTACGGGASNPPVIGTGTAVPASASQSQSVTPAGGSVSVSYGIYTVTLRVPAGAVATAATFKLTVYGSQAGVAALSAKRSVSNVVASSAINVVQFSVDDGGVPLVKPLQVSVATAAAPSGYVFRLAGYGGKAFSDVDTATYSGTSATSDLNIQFPRMSLASNTLYSLYVVPQGDVKPATPVVQVGTPSAAVGMFGTATAVASETDGNGFPYLDTSFTYALDNGTLGSIDPNTGVFTAGGIDAGGNVVATDTTPGRGNPTGKGMLTVSSQRPGNTGDAFSFSGTLSSTVQLTAGSTSTGPQTDTAAVTMTSTVGGFTPAGAGGTNAMTTAESDAYPYRTLTTTTKSAYSYTASAPAVTVRLLSTNATDSNGANYVTTYGTGNGLVDVLPETAGALGPNNAALTYTEADPANFGAARTVAANGSYTETDNDSLGDQQLFTVKSDFSASVDATQYSGLYFTMSKPSTANPSTITVGFYQYVPSANAYARLATYSVANWIPAGTTAVSTETDSDNGSVAYDAACNVPAKYGTAGNQIVQTIRRVDTAQGTAETETVTTWMTPSSGPACMEMTDSVKAYYDLTGQFGYGLYVSGTTSPIMTTSISETLALQSAATSNGLTTSSASKTVASVAPVSPAGGLAAVASVRARFEKTVREHVAARKTSFGHDFFTTGVHTL